MSSAKREIVLDRYLLLDAPLAGGMASIYKARDLEQDELVAIKRFDRDRLLPELEAEAFRREVEALRNLIHPNILKTRDPALPLGWRQRSYQHPCQKASSLLPWALAPETYLLRSDTPPPAVPPGLLAAR
jgi:hypothetical protein